MEYRYGSTRCEDDPLENEKGIGVAVRDAPNRMSVFLLFRSSSWRTCSRVP